MTLLALPWGTQVKMGQVRNRFGLLNQLHAHDLPRLWDFVFYASFGVVVTSSVRVGGVLLVFSYLIVPALAGAALGGSVATRLAIGWAFGTLVSVLGIVASAAFDLPTGATVVCAVGLTLLALAAARIGGRRHPS